MNNSLFPINFDHQYQRPEHITKTNHLIVAAKTTMGQAYSSRTWAWATQLSSPFMTNSSFGFGSHRPHSSRH
ncbi:hypothetical protein CCACVL1_28492 [Corchorus capsularis]|uniref:Uncharacterized protein n=1 Tax=Corchorus capsularis TaxID=210143 RepID=A0A1R3G6A9_COCAP|nr:hypothetical protein CCACVL1_28492 [Corchorus capsularis]